MKLLLCVKCNEIFSLRKTEEACIGGHIGGLYVDNIHAEVWGVDNKQGFILGIANNTLSDALVAQMAQGDRKDAMGREFTAFVIPDNAPSVTRKETE